MTFKGLMRQARSAHTRQLAGPGDTASVVWVTVAVLVTGGSSVVVGDWVVEGWVVGRVVG